MYSLSLNKVFTYLLSNRNYLFVETDELLYIIHAFIWASLLDRPLVKSTKKIFFLFLKKTYVVGTQKNSLNGIKFF